MDISCLKKIGLNDKEIKIYLALLEYGAISVRGLADVTDINRGTVYDTLKQLQEQGLVTYYHHETKQRFVAEDPEKITKLAQEKEVELKQVKNRIKDLIPELKSLQEKEGHRPVTKFYEGKSGVRYILEDVLKTMSEHEEKEYYIYSATKASDDINDAYPDFTKARIKKNIKVKAISMAKGGRMHGLDERKWLGTHDESATFILVYSGRCAFISRDAKGAPVGVIIENQMIYETQKIIFLQLWKLLK